MSTLLPPDILKNSPKTALITGAAQGIAAQIARRFIAEGYFVLIVDLNREAGEQMEKSLSNKAKFYPCDLSDSAQIRQLASTLLEAYETIDVIIHSAKSPAREANLLMNLEKEWESSLSVMLKHPILLNHLLLPKLKQSENPSILFIGSTNSYFISQQPLSYHVVKGALHQTVRYLACEYSAHSIRVNLLNPGIVDVPERPKKNPELFQKIIEAVIPLKRTALAKEVGDSALFLASNAAKYITGISLDLDGGEHLRDHFHLMMTHMQNKEEIVR